MTEKDVGRIAVLRGLHVIDGGLASELEYLGARIDGPLWSAHVLEDEPEKVLAVHRAYIAAGSQCIATCSYQVSRMGYAEAGFSPERADAALLRFVRLARSAAAESSRWSRRLEAISSWAQLFWNRHPRRRRNFYCALKVSSLEMQHWLAVMGQIPEEIIP